MFSTIIATVLASSLSIVPDFFGHMYADIISESLDKLSEIYDKKGKVYRNSHYSEKNRDDLILFLEKNGVPDTAIDFHCPVQKYFHDYSVGLSPDVSIVDTETLEPIAFFRVFEDLEDYNSERESNEQFYGDFYHYQKRAKQSSILYEIPYYLVWKHEGKLVFIDLKRTYNSPVDSSIYLDKPLRYGLLKSNADHREIRAGRINRKNFLSVWKYAFSILVPIICVILLFLDEKKVFVLSIERLIIIGIAFVSLLIPYLAQISIKDFSIDFEKKGKKGD